MLIKSYRLPVLLQMSGYESKNWNLKNMFRFYVFLLSCFHFKSVILPFRKQQQHNACFY